MSKDSIELDYEYSLFTKEDPIKLLRDDAKRLSIPKKFKIAPHIRRAEALVKQASKFRDIIIDENNSNNIVLGYTFASFFGEKIDKNVFLAIPRDPAYDFLRYINNTPLNEDDKYMKKVTALILSHSESINAFVKAFLSIRLAQGELDKLK